MNCKDHALLLLSYGPRAVKELRGKLLKKGYPEEEVDRVIRELERSGYLDDFNFALQWLEYRFKRKAKAESHVRKELRLKGIADEIISRAFSRFQWNDEEMAEKAMGNKMRLYKKLERAKARNRVTGFLRRRGFTLEVVNGILKRYFLIVMFVLLFGGCRSREPQTSIITWAAPRDLIESHMDLIRSFEKEHPEYKIRRISMPSSEEIQLESYYRYLSRGETYIDVYTINPIWLHRLFKTGRLLPLNDILPPEELKCFYLSSLTAGKIKDSYYAVPWILDAHVLYFRPKTLKGAPPATGKDLLDLAKQRLPRNALLYTLPLKDNIALALHFLELVRGEFFPDLIYCSACIEVLDSLIKLVHEYRVVPFLMSSSAKEEGSELFLKGKVLLYWGDASEWFRLKDGMEEELDFVPPLSWFEPGGECFLQGYYFSVTSASQHKEGAREFLRYMLRQGAQKFTLLRSKNFPARSDVYQEQGVTEIFPEIIKFHALFERAVSYPPFPRYPRELVLLGEGLKQAIIQGGESKEMLENAWQSIVSPGNE